MNSRTKKRNGIRFICFAAAVCLLLNCFSCAANPAAEPFPIPNEQSEPTPKKSAASADPSAGDTSTFALVVPRRDEFWEPMVESAVAFAEQKGWQTIVCDTSSGEYGTQGELFSQLIRMNVDGIAIAPAQEDNLAKYVGAAQSAGIPVVTIYRDIPLSGRTAFIGTDQTMAGRHMGKLVQERLNKNQTVLMLSSAAADAITQARMLGIRQVLGDKPASIYETETADAGWIENAEKELYARLSVYQDLIVVAVDSTAAEWMTNVFRTHAWKNDERHILLCFDDAAMNLTALKDGYISGIVAQLQGSWCMSALNMLRLVCEGRTVPNELISGTVEIHAGNIDTYKVEAPFED